MGEEIFELRKDTNTAGESRTHSTGYATGMKDLSSGVGVMTGKFY